MTKFSWNPQEPAWYRLGFMRLKMSYWGIDNALYALLRLEKSLEYSSDRCSRYRFWNRNLRRRQAFPWLNGSIGFGQHCNPDSYLQPERSYLRSRWNQIAFLEVGNAL